MAEFNAEAASRVVEASRAASGEVAEALGRGLDLKVSVSVGEPAPLDMKSLPEELAGPGLAVVLTVAERGALLVLPESSGMLPEWYGRPDPTGQSKLTTLAQELGMVLLPEEFMPDDFRAGKVKSLSGAVARGKVADPGVSIPLKLIGFGGEEGSAWLVFPLERAAAALGSGTSEQAPPKDPKEAKSKRTTKQPAAKQPARPPGPVAPTAPGGLRPGPQRVIGLEGLPPYSRSLLRVKVPVIVTLAEKRQPLKKIMDLGPGAIIQFDKSCEEMLDLAVGGRPVATGEAVKVGDRFGLRVQSMILPDERFRPVRGK